MEDKKEMKQFFDLEGGKSKSNAIEIPKISLPKGGGALKGIDEKFEVNAANGTAAFNIPLPITLGRNGFSPALSLSYNSGAGNGIFRLGWSLDFPSIQRKTDRQFPCYRNSGGEEDVYMFSGVEESFGLSIGEDVDEPNAKALYKLLEEAGAFDLPLSKWIGHWHVVDANGPLNEGGQEGPWLCQYFLQKRRTDHRP